MTSERDQARKDRLRAALRENLKRRKQQLRGRADHAAPAGDDQAVPDEGTDGPRPTGQNDRK
jgi:hypothetical protein